MSKKPSRSVALVATVEETAEGVRLLLHDATADDGSWKPDTFFTEWHLDPGAFHSNDVPRRKLADIGEAIVCRLAVHLEREDGDS